MKNKVDWVAVAFLFSTLGLFGFLIVYAQITNARMDKWAVQHGYTIHQVGFGEITNGSTPSR